MSASSTQRLQQTSSSEFAKSKGNQCTTLFAQNRPADEMNARHIEQLAGEMVKFSSTDEVSSAKQCTRVIQCEDMSGGAVAYTSYSSVALTSQS